MSSTETSLFMLRTPVPPLKVTAMLVLEAWDCSAFPSRDVSRAEKVPDPTFISLNCRQLPSYPSKLRPVQPWTLVKSNSRSCRSRWDFCGALGEGYVLRTRLNNSHCSQSFFGSPHPHTNMFEAVQIISDGALLRPLSCLKQGESCNSS